MPQDLMTFRELYDRHFDFVWRSVRRLGVSERDAPDVVQDVFVVVHRKLPAFEGRSKLSTWLFGIALRVVRDHQKLAYVRRHIPDAETIEQHADGTPDAEDQAERNEERKALEDILLMMPVDQRAVFVMFELEGMRGEEIAEAVGAPLGTVHSRLRLARDAFRKAVHRRQAALRPAAQGGAR